MLQNFVVGTDGSANAMRAVEVGAKLAAACGAHLTIVHIAPPYLSLADVEEIPELPPEARNEVKKIRDSLGGLEISAFAPAPAPQSAIEYIGNSVLDRSEKVARENGAEEISRVLAYGDPAEGIVAEAEKAGGDLIIIGTRGMGDLGGLVLGSVSHKVIHLAHCPCLTVK
ncbi:MAG: universal stress protein [Alphaproteobacteria bacterium]|nr:universal stress protein [Alphaproteobacteria bacterium]